ncbi:MAG: hypothetical protein ACYDD6_05730 [Acidimicrobiales bacterium]
MRRPTPPAPAAVAPGRWWNRRAVVAHGVLLVWLPGCAVASWWQVTVALDGDSLGWVYSVMWPCFAAFGVVLWWYFVHDDPETTGARGLRRLRQQAASGGAPEQGAPDETIARAETEDPALAAYNAYLSELARGPAKTWRRRR